MERNTIKEMREILDAIEQGKYIQFTYDGVNWNDADRCFKPYAPDFMHNKYCIKPEEPKRKKWRPFKDTTELFAHNGGHDILWLKNKYTNWRRMVTSYNDCRVTFDCEDDVFSMEILFENYTFADGTPCGVEEDAQ